jgi:hypothetical protein
VFVLVVLVFASAVVRLVSDQRPFVFRTWRGFRRRLYIRDVYVRSLSSPPSNSHSSLLLKDIAFGTRLLSLFQILLQVSPRTRSLHGAAGDSKGSDMVQGSLNLDLHWFGVTRSKLVGRRPLESSTTKKKVYKSMIRFKGNIFQAISCSSISIWCCGGEAVRVLNSQTLTPSKWPTHKEFR